MEIKQKQLKNHREKYDDATENGRFQIPWTEKLLYMPVDDLFSLLNLSVYGDIRMMTHLQPSNNGQNLVPEYSFQSTYW